MRLAALVLLVVAAIRYGDAVWFIRTQIFGSGWTLYPPGGFQLIVKDTFIFVALLLLAALLIGLSCLRSGLQKT
jgi:heme/copper-type cytochrome/quinol oxidase subunit 1